MIREANHVSVQRIAFLGILYQGVYAVTQMGAMAIIARQIDRGALGLWMTIVVVCSWVPLLSLGQNSVALTEIGKNAHVDPERAGLAHRISLQIVVVSTGTVLLAATALAIVNGWHFHQFGTDVYSTAQTLKLSIAAITMTAMGLPFVQIGYTVIAHRRGDKVHVSMIAGSLASLALVALAIQCSAPLLITGPLSLSGPLMGGFTLWLWCRSTILSPTVSKQNRLFSDSRYAFTHGLSFVVIELLTYLLLRSAEMIVARLHGVEAVAPFAAVGRLPALAFAAFQAILIPLWPALAAASLKQDASRQKILIWRSFALISALIVVSALVIPALGPTFITWWLGRPDYAPWDLMLAAIAQTAGAGFLAWALLIFGSLSMKRSLILILSFCTTIYLSICAAIGATEGPIAVSLAQAGSLLLVGLPMAIRVLIRFF